MESTRKRPNRYVLIAGLVVATLIIAASGFVWMITLGDQQIRGELAAIRDAGQPTSLEELWARYAEHGPSSPEADKQLNELLTQALEIRKIVENSYAPAYMDDRGQLTEPGRERVMEALQKQPGFVDRLEAFLKNPSSPVAPGSAATPEDYLKWSVRVTQNADSLAKVLRYWALLELSRNQFSDVARAAQNLVELGKWVRTFPGSMACTSALKATQDAINLWEALVQKDRSTVIGAVEGLKQALGQDNLLQLCRSAVIDDRALGLSLALRHPGRDSLWTRYSWNQFLLGYLRHFQTCLEALEKGNLTTALACLEPTGRAKEAEAYGMVFPLIRTCLNEGFLAETRRRQLLSALFLLQHEQESGADLPQDAAALSQLPFPAGVFVDPYDNKSLKIALLENQIVIYSVGLNGRDEGGQSPPAGDDVVFRLARKTSN